MKLFTTLDNIESQFDQLTSDALDDIAKEAQQHALNTNKFQYHKSSGLKGNINIINNGHFARTVIANKNYAYYLEFGNNKSGPFIYPTKAKFLHFISNGKHIFAKKVRSHPGYHFMRDARNYATKLIPGIIQKFFKRLF